MHFFTLVVLPPGSPTDDLEARVGKMMEPFYEGLEVEEVTEDGETYWTNPASFWDWYQIGGRWTGHLDGYEPEKDPANRETCRTCGGTGTRDWSGIEWDPVSAGKTLEQWIAECNGCNSCKGTGWTTTWPTQWADHPGDIARLGEVRRRLEESPPYYLVHEGVSRAERENPDWNGKFGPEGNGYLLRTTEIDETLAALSDDCTVVVVDCHN